ncbi:hypothetical protein JKP88DRAFT_268528 [Tribonema minus]|uniref:PHD-type domain-containing protein n=1 Tax=Tribonema minus TaxID=303371 RepID=A0A835Z065_9STRA|nr:hypothetical protein JKP88DRAFT_268528 [Tribonema minus]
MEAVKLELLQLVIQTRTRNQAAAVLPSQLRQHKTYTALSHTAALAARAVRLQKLQTEFASQVYNVLDDALGNMDSIIRCAGGSGAAAPDGTALLFRKLESLAGKKRRRGGTAQPKAQETHVSTSAAALSTAVEGGSGVSGWVDGLGAQAAAAAAAWEEAQRPAAVAPIAAQAKNERRYCHCGGVASGKMIACDSDNCPNEWYHYACVGITPPAPSQWLCADCGGPPYPPSVPGGVLSYSNPPKPAGLLLALPPPSVLAPPETGEEGSSRKRPRQSQRVPAAASLEGKDSVPRGVPFYAQLMGLQPLAPAWGGAETDEGRCRKQQQPQCARANGAEKDPMEQAGGEGDEDGEKGNADSKEEEGGGDEAGEAQAYEELGKRQQKPSSATVSPAATLVADCGQENDRQLRGGHSDMASGSNRPPASPCRHAAW